MHRLFFAVITFAVTIGCGDTPSDGESTTYVGALEGSDVRVAIVHDEEAVQAYVCGTGDSLVSHTRWFEGPLDRASGSFELSEDGWRLHATTGGRPLRGTLESPDGVVQNWSLIAATEETEVGLYEAYFDDCRDGIIVFEEIPGPSCAAQGSWCDPFGNRGQVTPVNCQPDRPLVVEGVRDGVRFEFEAQRVDAR